MASPVIVGEGRMLASVEQSVAVVRPHFKVKVGFGHLTITIENISLYNLVNLCLVTKTGKIQFVHKCK